MGSDIQSLRLPSLVESCHPKSFVLSSEIKECLGAGKLLAKQYQKKLWDRESSLFTLGTLAMKFADQPTSTAAGLVTQNVVSYRKLNHLYANRRAAVHLIELKKHIANIDPMYWNTETFKLLKKTVLSYEKLLTYQKAQTTSTIVFHASTILASSSYFLSACLSTGSALSTGLYIAGNILASVACAEFGRHYCYKRGENVSLDSVAKRLHDCCKKLLE